jgi:hypothetical protein
MALFQIIAVKQHMRDHAYGSFFQMEIWLHNTMRKAAEYKLRRKCNRKHLDKHQWFRNTATK